MNPPGGMAGRAGANVPSLLKNSEGFVLALLESASQAILAIDAAGRIVLANGRAEQIFGYVRQELLQAPMEMLLPESKRSVHLGQRNEFMAHPRVRPMGIGMDLAARRKDGTEFPVEISLSHIQTEEGVFAIAFVSDISQRKLLEEQLAQAQKMEAVGRLAGGVAHDFNNMLTVISGYTRMILDELPPDDALRANAEEIQMAADRAAGLTNQLLTFSRRQVMRPRVINVNTVLAETEKMLRRLIGEDIVLTLNPAPEVGNIRADPGHIEQAIVNLVVNARDAMPNGGHITIETANVVLDNVYATGHLGVNPGDYVMIAVSDTGFGMNAETKRHIFEPFYTTKPKGKGTGLGLATVYGMVKQSGGDIWVYSEPGRGTTFKLYFPTVAESATGSEGRDAAPTKSRGHETILVVEDEEAVRDLTVRILRQLGYTVLTASAGAEALEIANAHQGPITLLVTDVVMPGMTGKQLAGSLMQNRPDLRVLYVSGYTENTVLSRGGLDPGVEFLPKPFSREMLASKLRSMLDPPEGRARQ